MVRALLLVALLAGAPAVAQADRLGPAKVAGVDVAGLSPAQARQRLRRELAPKLRQPLRITDGVKTVTRTRAELGVGLDVDGMVARAKAGQGAVPLELKVDRPAFRAALRRLAPGFAFKGLDAKPYAWQGQVHVRPSQHKRVVDVDRSAERLADQLESRASTTRLVLSLNKTPTRLTSDKLKGIDGRLASYTTRFNPARRNRTHNLRLGAKAINGTLLSPGEVFSLNDTVGNRTPQRGYRKATIFADGRLAEDYGGGISQVTGTLFNAALEAGLPIVTYRCHSRPVSYIPIGRDATVAYGQFDMKFRNDTGAPIYIAYTTGETTATATLFGRKTPGRQVSLKVVHRKLGERHEVAKLYRTIKVNGQVKSKRQLGTTEYRWKPDEQPD